MMLLRTSRSQLGRLRHTFDAKARGSLQLLSRRMLNTDASEPQQNSSAGPTSPSVPQSQPWPGLPSSTAPSTELQPTIVTSLANGVRVASENTAGPWCTVGVIVGMGCRHETEETAGAAYFVDRLAFRGTVNQTDDEMRQNLERIGGNVTVTSMRENILFLANVYRDDVDSAIELLADAIRYPSFTDEKIAEQAFLVPFEHERRLDTPHEYIQDFIHRAAYGSQGLGRAPVCTEEDAKKVTSKTVYKFWKENMTPDRVVVAAAGVDHNQLVETAERHFGSLLSAPAPAVQPSKYVGGQFNLVKKPAPIHPALQIPLTHVAIGFEAPTMHDQRFFAAMVLQYLLGGGTSFSAGGPGKGIYTRFYQRVLGRFHWIESAEAACMSYTDSGLFWVQTSAPTNQADAAAKYVLNETLLPLFGMSDEELTRAKNHLRSTLLMNLEMRSIVFEDIARQVEGQGHRKSADELCDAIDSVTRQDVLSLLTSMAKSPPSVAVLGEPDSIATPEAVSNMIKPLFG